MNDPRDDLATLIFKLRHPKPIAALTDMPKRTPIPIYSLSVDEPHPLAIILIVRTGNDGIPRAKIILPRWEELAAGWDGPHTMDIALPLANSYAHDYGYQSIVIDIESSQLWDDAWGRLEKSGGE
jgi:hypothetical protein